MPVVTCQWYVGEGSGWADGLIYFRRGVADGGDVPALRACFCDDDILGTAADQFAAWKVSQVQSGGGPLLDGVGSSFYPVPDAFVTLADFGITEECTVDLLTPKCWCVVREDDECDFYYGEEADLIAAGVTYREASDLENLLAGGNACSPVPPSVTPGATKVWLCHNLGAGTRKLQLITAKAVICNSTFQSVGCDTCVPAIDFVDVTVTGSSLPNIPDGTYRVPFTTKGPTTCDGVLVLNGCDMEWACNSSYECANVVVSLNFSTSPSVLIQVSLSDVFGCSAGAFFGACHCAGGGALLTNTVTLTDDDCSGLNGALSFSMGDTISPLWVSGISVAVG